MSERDELANRVAIMENKANLLQTQASDLRARLRKLSPLGDGDAAADIPVVAPRVYCDICEV